MKSQIIISQSCGKETEDRVQKLLDEGWEISKLDSNKWCIIFVLTKPE